MPIKHTDGAEYFSAAEVEETIKARVKNHADRVTSLETAARDAEARLKAMEPQIAQVTTLTAERDQLKARAETAEGTHKRYQAAAGAGITDPDTIWALEQAHTRAMAGVEEAKRVDFAGYLGQVKADPLLAPAYLRPVLAGGMPAPPAAGAPPPAAPPPQPAAGAPPPGSPPAAPPAPGQPGTRPAWAPAIQGQQPVDTGARQDFTARVQSAKTLEDIATLQRERRTQRVG